MKKYLSTFISQLSSPKGFIRAPLSWRSGAGFTLIELLVVIAVIGVLASIVVVGINPVEQLARGRDAGRKTTVGQLAKAVQAYYTSRNAVYPAVGNSWMNTLSESGEIKSVPVPIAYSITTGASACGPSTRVQSGYCYITSTTPEAAVYVRLESSSERSKCAVENNPYFMWDSSRGTTCLVCTAADVAIGNACNTTQ